MAPPVRVPVRTEVIESALRGGEPARSLAQNCTERRIAAEAGLVAARAEAPKIIVAFRERTGGLEKQEKELCDDLETISDALDDLVASSEKSAAQAAVAKQKLNSLDELAVLLGPFLSVSKALEDAESAETRTVAELQETLSSLDRASKIASESANKQLRDHLPTLQDRTREITSMMEFRFLDLVTITENRVSVAPGAASGKGSASSPANALANAGLLFEALQGVVGKLESHDVAKGLRSATVFVSSGGEGDTAASVEWHVGADSGGELLEFDLDDLEDISDDDVDAMTAALDIANAAARAVRLFDLIRNYAIGEAHSEALARAFHPWLERHIIPPDVVLSSLREEHKDTGVPPEALRERILATSATARVLQSAFQARGADSSAFVVRVDTSTMESAVASECRGMTVLAARKAIGTFADARHDATKVTACPLASHEYVQPSERTPDFFPPCMVSRAAAVVLDVFLKTRTDALQALAGGSRVIGEALLSSAYECVDAYRTDVPLQHGEEMRGSLRLKSLYYNDCMTLKHACLQAAEIDKHEFHKGDAANGMNSVSAEGPHTDVASTLDALARAAESTMTSMRRSAEKGLMDNLNSACRNGGIGASGTLTRIQRSSALAAAHNAIRELVLVFAELVPLELAELAAASMCDMFLRTLCDAVLALDEIMPDACEQIDDILHDAVDKVRKLMVQVAGMERLRQGGATPDVVIRLGKSLRRAEAYRHVLSARMEDIVRSFRDGKYGDAIDRETVEAFLLKIFEDTPLRATFISELDLSKEQEKAEWGDDW